MAVEVQEVLMAQGEWSVDFKRDPEVISKLVDYAHLLFYWGNRWVYTGVILTRDPGDQYKVKGRGLEWHEGMEQDGPIVRFREYLSGKSKLSNGGFDNQDLYWQVDDNTNWTFADGMARHTSDYGKDDVMASIESSEGREGIQYLCRARVRRVSGAGAGRLRLRGACEGSYSTPNLIPNGDFESADLQTPSPSIVRVTDPANAFSGTHVIKVGPIPQKQVILNPSLENIADEEWGTPADWYGSHFDDTFGGTGLHMHFSTRGPWSALPPGSLPFNPVDGDYIGDFGFLGPSYEDGSYYYWAQADCSLTGTAGFANPADVLPGEKWVLEGYILQLMNSDGKCWLSLLLLDDTWPAAGSGKWLDAQHVDGATDISARPTEWKYQRLEYEVKAEVPQVVDLLPQVNVDWGAGEVDGTYAGAFEIDLVTLTRIVGNIEEAIVTTIPVTPEKQYNFLATLKADPNIGGTMWFRFRYQGADRPDIIQDMSAEEGTEGEWKVDSSSVAPQSGYDTLVVSIVGKDVAAGSFWVDKLLLFLQDTAEVVFDLVSPAVAADWTWLEQTVTCPPSTTGFHVSVIAESLAVDWEVDEVEAIRVDMVPKTFKQIMNELRIHPKTGLATIKEGTIVGNDTPQWDWVIKNMSTRDCWRHACQSGLFLPLREYQVTPDNLLNSDIADRLFTDRKQFVLEAEDIEIIDRPSKEVSVEASITDLTIIGAERKTTDRRFTRTVTGSAHVDLPGTDFEGNPIVRERVIEDSSADHDDYAAALAEADLEQNNHKSQSVTVQLSEWGSIGHFDVGDVGYLYDKNNDIQDEANAMQWKGRMIFPLRDRILSRTWEMGAGRFRVYLLGDDGIPTEVTDFINWSDATKASLEIGSLPFDFAVDPQGGAAGNQFNRYRTQRP